MIWNDIFEKVPIVVKRVREDYIFDNAIIRDDIFRILEKHCTVVYYPLCDEKRNRGFHIKRYMNGKLEDFVYINTAQSLEEQVFAAAHELGHVWNVADKIWEELALKEKVTGEVEEKIVSRFAAELLMPKDDFKKSFFAHIKDMKYDASRIRLEEIIRVMVWQMSDYMVPFEAVRRRMIETGLISEEIGDDLLLDKNGIDEIVNIYIKDLNTGLSIQTMKKTIPGLRDIISEREKKGTASEYLLHKIKEDFDLSEVNISEGIMNISDKDN